jgi:hypothetical protein
MYMQCAWSITKKMQGHERVGAMANKNAEVSPEPAIASPSLVPAPVPAPLETLPAQTRLSRMSDIIRKALEQSLLLQGHFKYEGTDLLHKRASMLAFLASTAFIRRLHTEWRLVPERIDPLYLPAIKLLLSKAPLPVSAFGELAGPLLKSGLVATSHARDGGVELVFAAPLVRQCLLMRILLAVPPDGVQASRAESLSKSIEVALEGLDLQVLQKALSTESSGKRISEVQWQELFAGS